MKITSTSEKTNEALQSERWLLAAETKDAIVTIDETGCVFWKSGTWISGTWYAGTWEDGFWYDGSWIKGTWLGGNWKSGTWEDGNWYAGIWRDVCTAV